MSSFASTAASVTTKNTIRFHRRRAALLQANIGVLGQKLDLMEALRTHLGRERANQKFAEKCSVVGASVGQHFRHSNDHMETLAKNLIRRDGGDGDGDDDDGDDNIDRIAELHYDIRIRGGNDENDMDASEERTRTVADIFRRAMDETLSSSSPMPRNGDGVGGGGVETVFPEEEEREREAVRACFLLSGDPSGGEFSLPSTIDRELGFVAHHAIHHLAMVKIISVHTLRLLPAGSLPEGFGMAPSTIVYDLHHHDHRQPN